MTAPVDLEELKRLIAKACEEGHNTRPLIEELEALRKYYDLWPPAPAWRRSVDELEICRLSAEALGKTDIRTPSWGDKQYVVHWQDGSHRTWNPLTNAEQRWECMEWLLQFGNASVALFAHKEHHYWAFDLGGDEMLVQLDCPASEFPARAVAELRRRQK